MRQIYFQALISKQASNQYESKYPKTLSPSRKHNIAMLIFLSVDERQQINKAHSRSTNFTQHRPVSPESVGSLAQIASK